MGVVLALSAARADAAKAAAPSMVEEYTALAKEYVAKAQKMAEDISAQAQETVSRRVLERVLSSCFVRSAAPAACLQGRAANHLFSSPPGSRPTTIQPPPPP